MGYLHLELNDGTGAYFNLGEWYFQDIVYTPGGTSFSGTFALPGGGTGGFFEGVFTGPGASELMVRWQAPFIDPEFKTQGTIYGVWIGSVTFP